jgi:hypothetical protein
VHVDVVRDRRALLLGELAEEPASACEQREPAQQAERQGEVGEHGAADARPVERQRPAEYLRVHPADRLEQPQVRAARALLGRDLDEPWRARVADLVHRVAEAGHELARCAGLRHGIKGERVIKRVIVRASVVGWDLSRLREHGGQVLAAVLGDPEETGPAAEQAGRDRPLQRVGRRQVGEPGGDGGRRETVVGQRDEYRLEDAHLGLGRTALRHHPQHQLAEADRAHQVVGEVLAEEGDVVGIRGAERGGVFVLGHAQPSGFGDDNQARISSPCSSSSGGASG